MASRAAALALAVGASLASAAMMLKQEAFSAADCGAASLEMLDQMFAIGTPISFGGTTMKYTCTDDSVTLSICADTTCSNISYTNLPMARGVCKEEEAGKWVKLDCVESAGSGFLSQVYSAQGCAEGTESSTSPVSPLGCRPAGEFADGTWTQKSEKNSFIGNTLMSEMFASKDCTGTKVDTNSMPCDTCLFGGETMSFKLDCSAYLAANPAPAPPPAGPAPAPSGPSGLFFREQEYSAAGCTAASLEKDELSFAIGAVVDRGDGSFMKASCEADKVVFHMCSDSACGTAQGTFPMSRGICEEDDVGRWVKRDCVAASGQGLTAQMFPASKTCSGSSSTVQMGKLGCNPKGEFEDGSWSPKSEKLSISAGGAVVETYGSRDCSGASTDTKTHSCGVCLTRGEMSYNINCPGTVSGAPGAMMSCAIGAAAIAVLSALL